MNKYEFKEKCDKIDELKIPIDWYRVALSFGVHFQTIANWRNGFVPEKKEGGLGKMNDLLNEQIKECIANCSKLL